MLLRAQADRKRSGMHQTGRPEAADGNRWRCRRQRVQGDDQIRRFGGEDGRKLDRFRPDGFGFERFQR